MLNVLVKLSLDHDRMFNYQHAMVHFWKDRDFFQGTGL